MKIGMKMAAGFGIVIGLLIVISLVGIGRLKAVTDSYQTDVVKELEVSNRAEAIQIHLLQVRRREKDFMARKDLKYVDQIKSHLDAVDQLADEMAGMTSTQAILPKLEEIKSGVDAYREGFDRLAQAQVDRGLTEKEGIQGAFRQAAHAFEEGVKSYSVRDGMTLYLTMRRHEKDYMLRGQEKYIERGSKTLNQLRENVLSSSLGAENKATFFELLETYEKEFKALVEKDGEIKSLLGSIKKSADGALALAEEVTVLEREQVDHQEEAISSTTRSAIRLLWIVGVLAILAGVGAALFLTRMDHPAFGPGGEAHGDLAERGHCASCGGDPGHVPGRSECGGTGGDRAASGPIQG